MTLNTKRIVVSSSVNAAFIGGIGVSTSDSELSAFDISRDVSAFRLF